MPASLDTKPPRAKTPRNYESIGREGQKRRTKRRLKRRRPPPIPDLNPRTGYGKGVA